MDTNNNMNNDMNGGQFSGAPQQAPQPAQQQGYQTYQQPGYQQPGPDAGQYGGPVTVNNYGYVPQEMTVGRWMLTLFLTGIPIVGFVLLIVWAASSSPDNRSRKNWAIAQFVWVLILIVLAILLSVLTGGALLAGTRAFY